MSASVGAEYAFLGAGAAALLLMHARRQRAQGPQSPTPLADPMAMLPLSTERS